MISSSRGIGPHSLRLSRCLEGLYRYRWQAVERQLLKRQLSIHCGIHQTITFFVVPGVLVEPTRLKPDDRVVIPVLANHFAQGIVHGTVRQISEVLDDHPGWIWLGIGRNEPGLTGSNRAR